MAIQARFYQPRMIDQGEAGPGRLVILINSEPGDVGGRLLVEATAGTVLRLVQLAGGREVKTELLSAVWEGAEANRLEVKWEE